MFRKNKSNEVSPKHPTIYFITTLFMLGDFYAGIIVKGVIKFIILIAPIPIIIMGRDLSRTATMMGSFFYHVFPGIIYTGLGLWWLLDVGIALCGWGSDNNGKDIQYAGGFGFFKNLIVLIALIAVIGGLVAGLAYATDKSETSAQRKRIEQMELPSDQHLAMINTGGNYQYADLYKDYKDTTKPYIKLERGEYVIYHEGKDKTNNIKGKEYNWAFVDYEGLTGYVQKSYLEIKKRK